MISSASASRTPSCPAAMLGLPLAEQLGHGDHQALQVAAPFQPDVGAVDARGVARQRLVARLVLAGLLGLLVERLGDLGRLVGVLLRDLGARLRRPRSRSASARRWPSPACRWPRCTRPWRTSTRRRCRPCAARAGRRRSSARSRAAAPAVRARPAPSAARCHLRERRCFSVSAVLRASMYFCSSASFSVSLASFSARSPASSSALACCGGQRLDLRLQLLLLHQRERGLQLDVRHDARRAAIPRGRSTAIPRATARRASRRSRPGRATSCWLPEGCWPCGAGRTPPARAAWAASRTRRSPRQQQGAEAASVPSAQQKANRRAVIVIFMARPPSRRRAAACGAGRGRLLGAGRHRFVGGAAGLSPAAAAAFRRARSPSRWPEGRLVSPFHRLLALHRVGERLLACARSARAPPPATPRASCACARSFDAVILARIRSACLRVRSSTSRT